MSVVERERLGRAVENKNLRFTSVSQVKLFDPTVKGGCNRRFVYRYVFGKTEPKSAAAEAGDEYAKQLEIYLKTGDDILVPVLRAGKHLLPKPGSDLEVEQPLGDIVKAAELRDAYLNGRGPLDLARLTDLAGLVAAGIPFAGAADYRHRRGEYVDAGGTLHREDAGMVVTEIGDHKTTKRIDDHTTRGGTLLEGKAKTVEQVLADAQMIGYGVQEANRHPEVTHLRLGHNYYQTEGVKTAAKRSGLITVGELRDRWRRVESVVREMADVVAHTTVPEDAPVSLWACHAFFAVCPHSEYCDRPGMTIYHVLGTERGDSMSNGLFDTLTATAPTNGLHGDAGLFTPQATVLESSPPAAPPNDAERAVAFEVERARLAAEDTRAPLLAPHIGAVNPPDAPPDDPVAAAAPLSPEVIATITDPEIKKRAEDHAAAAAAKAAAQAGVQPEKAKASGKCSGGGLRVQFTDEQIKLKQTKKYVCPKCGKVLTTRPSADNKEATLPGHLLSKEMTSVAPSLPPPLPEYVAPDALPGQMAMPAAVAPPLPVSTTTSLLRAHAEMLVAIANDLLAIAEKQGA